MSKIIDDQEMSKRSEILIGVGVDVVALTIGIAAGGISSGWVGFDLLEGDDFKIVLDVKLKFDYLINQQYFEKYSYLAFNLHHSKLKKGSTLLSPFYVARRGFEPLLPG